MKADYRKINDRTHSSSTYHKKDGTNVRAKMKEQLQQEVVSQVKYEPVQEVFVLSDEHGNVFELTKVDVT